VKLARKPFLVLSFTFLAALAAMFFASQSPNAAEGMNKEEIEKIVREYLTANPQVVVEALEAYQANQEDIEAKRFKDTISGVKGELYEGDLPFAGNPKGDVTVVEFFDYNCGYCKRAVTDIKKVIDNDPNVKFVFREMPILSEASGIAARYAFAAHKQGKYFDYHQALMKFPGNKDKENLEKIGKEIGLDVEKLSKDAESAEVRAEIEKSTALSRKLGIRGTPAFIFGNTLAPGYIPYEGMVEMIAKARDDKG